MTDTTVQDEDPRPLRVIADEIFRDWKAMRERGESHPAWPYADAMRSLGSIEESYYADSGRAVVRYFISNAAAWRGETAKRVKAELKAMLDG